VKGKPSRLPLLLALAAVATACAQAQSALPPTTVTTTAHEAQVETNSAAAATSDGTTTTSERAPDEPQVQSMSVAQSPPSFEVTISAIDDGIAARMKDSWRPGCPVGLDDLRLVTVSHHTFGGGVATGEIVVHADMAEDIAAVFGDLFAAGYPIERMELVDEYAADDDLSMAANNTSAFNCRTVAGTGRWSQHAYGMAVDVNPLLNPYVRNGRADPPAGSAYVDRSVDHPGIIRDRDAVVTAFAAIGWSWGGYWSSPDYQHFSRNGR